MKGALTVRTVTLAGQDTTPFEEVFAVEDEPVVSEATKVLSELDRAVDPETHEFHLSEAQKIVESDPGLAIVHSLSDRDSMRVEVRTMAERFHKSLLSLIGVALPKAAAEKLQEVALHAFEDLESQLGDAWFHITSESPDSTIYQYNVALVVQNEETGFWYYVIPVALRVQVDVGVRELLSLQGGDEVGYSVETQALKVAGIVEAAALRRPQEVAS